MTSQALGKVKKIAESAVIIAGGTSGIGLAAAVRFAKEGCHRIALIGRNETRGAAAKKQVEAVGSDIVVEFISANAENPDEVQAAVDKAYELLGNIDIMVSSVAASYFPKLLFKTPMDEISSILTGQALPPMLLSRAVLPYMMEQRSGVILNIASDAAKVPTPGETVIGAGMSAIVLFSRTLAIEAKRNGIRVNALTPSLVEGTLINQRIMTDPFAAKLFENAGKLANLGVVEAEDMADLIIYLCGPGAAKITGQAISMNGGISAG